MLIAIEGIDGSGKATLTAALAQALGQAGQHVRTETFPRYGATILSRSIVEALASDADTLTPQAAAAMFAAERLESREHLQSLLEDHATVILDRYVHSNAAYQAARVTEAEQHDFIEWVLGLEFNTFRLPRPDLVVFIDTDTTEAAQRRKKRSEQGDLDGRPEADEYEANTTMLERAHACFSAMSRTDPTCPWVRIDGSAGAENNAQSIVAYLQEAGALHRDTARGGNSPTVVPAL